MTEFVLLRLIHVLSGVFWTGTTLFTAGFLMPTLRDAGPAAGPIMAGLQKRRLMVVMPITATLTILSGARLLWLVSGGFAASYFGTTVGLTFGLSGAAALTAFILGMAVGRPAMARAGMLAQEAAQSADRERLLGEANRLRQRAGAASVAAAVLLLLATAGMATARYL